MDYIKIGLLRSRFAEYDTESSLICSKIRATLASLSQTPDIDTAQMVNNV
jgi:hypothetical protein